MACVHAATRTHDQHGTHHAARDKHPTQFGDMLFQHKPRQDGDCQWRQHRDRAKFGNRHTNQATKGQKTRCQQQQTTNDLKLQRTGLKHSPTFARQH